MFATGVSQLKLEPRRSVKLQSELKSLKKVTLSLDRCDTGAHVGATSLPQLSLDHDDTGGGGYFTPLHYNVVRPCTTQETQKKSKECPNYGEEAKIIKISNGDVRQSI